MSTTQAGARGVRDVALLNGLNKTGSAIPISLFWLGCSQGIDFTPEFLYRVCQTNDKMLTLLISLLMAIILNTQTIHQNFPEELLLYSGSHLYACTVDLR